MEVWHRGGGSWRAQPAGDPSRGKAVTARVLQASPGVCSPAVSVRVPDARCTHLLGGSLVSATREDTRAATAGLRGRSSLAHPAAPTGSTRLQTRTPRLLSPRRGSLHPRLTRAAPGAGERAAGFSQRNGVSGRAEVPYLFPQDQAPAPASSPLGASCRGRGPSSWAPTCCPRVPGGRDGLGYPLPLAPAACSPSAGARRLSYRAVTPSGGGERRALTLPLPRQPPSAHLPPAQAPGDRERRLWALHPPSWAHRGRQDARPRRAP